MEKKKKMLFLPTHFYKGFIEIFPKSELFEPPILEVDEYKINNQKCEKIKLKKTEKLNVYSYLFETSVSDYPLHFIDEIIKLNPNFKVNAVVLPPHLAGLKREYSKTNLIVYESKYEICLTEYLIMGPFKIYKPLQKLKFYPNFLISFRESIMTLILTIKRKKINLPKFVIFSIISQIDLLFMIPKHLKFYVQVDKSIESKLFSRRINSNEDEENEDEETSEE